MIPTLIEDPARFLVLAQIPADLRHQEIGPGPDLLARLQVLVDEFFFSILER